MKIFNLVLLTLIVSGRLFAQELMLDDGIYIEKPDYATREKHRYSRDNISYKLNKVFIFDHYYLDNGVKKKFLLRNNDSNIANPLNLASGFQPSDSVIDKIKL